MVKTIYIRPSEVEISQRATPNQIYYIGEMFRNIGKYNDFLNHIMSKKHLLTKGNAGNIIQSIKTNQSFRLRHIPNDELDDIVINI